MRNVHRKFKFEVNLLTVSHLYLDDASIPVTTRSYTTEVVLGPVTALIKNTLGPKESCWSIWRDMTTRPFLALEMSKPFFLGFATYHILILASATWILVRPRHLQSEMGYGR